MKELYLQLNELRTKDSSENFEEAELPIINKARVNYAKLNQ